MRFGIGFNFPNYRDWDRFLALEHGASPEQAGPMLVSDEQVWQEQLGLADLVEPLGFDILWTFEQHASPYIMLPDAHQYLAYFAGRTKRIDFGSMIVVLPWHHPIRVAEQIAMLQHQMGRGRKYFMGIGRGLARRNFAAMSVDPQTSRERFWEVFEIVKLALTQEVFSYQGKFFTFENVSIRPRPLDPAVIVDAWGASTSERSLREMAARGLQPVTTPNKTRESYLQDMDLFNRIREDEGHGPPKRPIFQVPLYCSEDAHAERDESQEWIRTYVDSVLKMYELGTDNFAKGEAYAEYRTKGSDFGSGTPEDAVETLTTKFMRDGIIGTPEECVEQVAAHYEIVRPSEFVVLSAYGTMPVDKARRSMELYAEKVIPRFAHLRNESDVYESQAQAPPRSALRLEPVVD